jgi:alkylhydroperoxidase family enzyme
MPVRPDRERPATPRLAPLDDAAMTDEQRSMIEPAKVLRDPPLNIFTTLVRHPKLYRRAMALGSQFMFEGLLTPRQREVVILRVAGRTCAEYEYGQHVEIGQGSGLSLAEIESLVSDELAPSIDEVERALVAMVDDLCAEDCVSDSTWAALATHFDDRQIMEAIVLAGYYRLLAGLLNSCGVQLDEGITGWP